MTQLIPYLMFNGNCEEAIEFYKDCFNGEIGYMGRYSDSPMEVSEENKDKIMHVDLKFLGNTLYASDDITEANLTTISKESKIHLNLNFDNEDEMLKVFNKLKVDGTVVMEIEQQFWGDKFGMLTDKYGFQWMFICPGE